ncbi:MAG TPA: hypothetical protein VG841_02565 [Caulobacterales bacterium]|nr:hypothetical protein [Caulobacterales bacterium]
MLRTTTALALILGLSACATTAPTSWGKPGVTMVQYRIDSAECIIEASGAGAGTAVASNQDRGQADRGSGGSGGGGAASGAGVNAGASGSSPTGGAISYSGSAPADEVNQAALEQRRREMSQRRAQVNGVGECLRSRGYREFRLTQDQAAHLKTLPEGSEERRNYLYSLGVDPHVLNAQGL